MTTILAIDTASDACSVALYREGVYEQRYAVAPRQHSQIIFSMLSELLPDGRLRQQGVEAIAYGCGPGSFTGLRIAASAVQGLAFANDLPAIPVSTLACQAVGAVRLGLIDESTPILSVLDARINEIYAGVYTISNGVPRLHCGPVVCAPEELQIDGENALQAVGSGCVFVDKFPAALRHRLVTVVPEALPQAMDLVPTALDRLATGDVQSAAQVQPVYVRDEISWKKISEQGKRP